VSNFFLVKRTFLHLAFLTAATGLDVVRAIRTMTHASGEYAVADHVYLEGVRAVAPGVVVVNTGS
jgi:hypothetical protein